MYYNTGQLLPATRHRPVSCFIANCSSSSDIVKSLPAGEAGKKLRNVKDLVKISWLMLGDVCLCFLCSRRNNPWSGAAAHHFHPAPAAAWAWPEVKCHLSPSPVPYTGLHWPRLHKVVPVWRLCPLWAGEQGGGGAAVWAQPPPAQSRSLSDDEQQRAESIGKHLLSCQWMY